ncbi:glutaredoxin domain-containing protein [Actinophytocola sp.]|uniref:glutaredoxin domain-containing protein n=1 Tax=Actinophytocola sp. TaxID=1872138 RepID=UPI003D6AEAD3
MTAQHATTVYWRPGCPYCSRLLGDLGRTGLPIRKVNIWEDPAAAATVRSIANGNETVPTVVISNHTGDHGMVNPRAADVLDAVRDHAPDLLDDLDPKDIAAAATGPWWAGLVVTLAVTVGWFVAATGNPTTTYHFAPALVAAAWPVGRRLRAGRALPVGTALATTAGSAALAGVTTLLLATGDALAGPTLFGIPTALTETLASIATGTVVGVGLAIAGITGRRRRP